MKIRNLLVPVDFSEFSNRAVSYAISLSEIFNARITLLHVVTLFHEDVKEESLLKKYESKIQQKLKLHQSAANKKGVEVESVLLRGFSAADKILEFIQENDFDLVVIGSHGRTGIKHLIHGSVSERVVRLSPVPVLTIHHSTKKFDPRTILIPIDFSKFSKTVAQEGISLAQKFNAKIIFLHVIEQVMHPAFYAASIESIFQIDPALKARALERLKAFVDGIHLPSEYLVIEGKAYKEIADCAREKKADLIVMATRGLTGLDYFLMGSNAERVVRMAECSVLTVARSEK
jgi:nucleotide-binding universal stress UspA family protein